MVFNIVYVICSYEFTDYKLIPFIKARSGCINEIARMIRMPLYFILTFVGAFVFVVEVYRYFMRSPKSFYRFKP